MIIVLFWCINCISSRLKTKKRPFDYLSYIIIYNIIQIIEYILKYEGKHNK